MSKKLIPGWNFVIADAAYSEKKYTEKGLDKTRRYFHVLFYRIDKSGKECWKWVRFPMNIKNDYFDKLFMVIQDPSTAKNLKDTLDGNKGIKIKDIAEVLIEAIKSNELNFLIDWDRYTKIPSIKSISPSIHVKGDEKFVSKPDKIEWPKEAKEHYPDLFGPIAVIKPAKEPEESPRPVEEPMEALSEDEAPQEDEYLEPESDIGYEEEPQDEEAEEIPAVSQEDIEAFQDMCLKQEAKHLMDAEQTEEEQEKLIQDALEAL
jgi:hypothetical protein